MNPAILIISYKRPENVALILTAIKEYQNRVYIFVDLDETHEDEKNFTMIAMAREYENDPQFSVFVAEKNFGVGRAVPAALDWVLGFEESVIILEDDCIPSTYTISYLTKMLLNTQNNSSILLVSGSNPLKEDQKRAESSISSFPLIWGWAIWKDNWLRIAPYVRHEVNLQKILLKLILNPRKATEIAFFMAAYLRSYSGITKAWDCNLALGMLIEDYKAIIPNENTITNIGNDSVASHTFFESDQKEIITASNKPPSDIINMSGGSLDLAISREIYNLRPRHLFSPIKASIQIARHKVRHVL